MLLYVFISSGVNLLDSVNTTLGLTALRKMYYLWDAADYERDATFFRDLLFM